MSEATAQRTHWLALPAGLAVTFVFTAPMVWMFLASFKTIGGIFSIPPQWIPDFGYLENYAKLLRENWPFLLNSVVVTLGATALCLILALPTAFGLVFFRFRGREFFADWILSTRMMPPIAAGVPLYMIFNGLGMLDSRTALVIAYAGFDVPFAVWVAMSFFRRVPKETIEAAQLEGFHGQARHRRPACVAMRLTRASGARGREPPGRIERRTGRLADPWCCAAS